MRQAGALALRQPSQRNRGLERDRLQRALKKSEIVAILGLLALFTHIHLFWVAGLLLAMIELGRFKYRLLLRAIQPEDQVSLSDRRTESGNCATPASPPVKPGDGKEAAFISALP